MFLGLGAGAKKTYIDNIFSTFLRRSTGATATVVNGIDLSGEGGLVWTKSRSNAFQHVINDSIRGANHILASNTDTGSVSGYAGSNTFTSTGYSIAGGDATNNASGYTYVDWSFRKAPGFFDVVSWTGNGNGSRQISHSLESVPGCIMIKRTDGSYGWYVYHRGLDSSNPERYYLRLNETNASQNTTGQQWMAAAPTSTNFTLAADIGGSGYEGLNTNGQTYIAYVFAGGESTAATARSVDFDGSNDYLSIPDSSDFTIGTNYTAECWFYADAITGNGWDGIFGQWSGNNNAATNSWVLESVGNSFTPRFYYINSGGTLAFKTLVNEANAEVLPLKQWHHFAFVKSGSTTKLYLNGILKQSFDTTYQDGSGSFNIGGNVASGGWFNGKISNVRIVNGTAVYTSSFRPPTEPLTNITNTKLLCCNDSSTTGSTVTPGTITNNGATASSDSPFDDPAAFTFGDAGDQNVIKTGSYVGSGSSGLDVNIGFEPQWVMVKNTDAGGLWLMADNMRGVVTGEDDPYLRANATTAEYTVYNWIEFTPTGFKLTNTGVSLNASGNKYVYLCIRRPDGYVGKPLELGTSAFAMDTGAGGSTIPNFDSLFPVDFTLGKTVASSTDWFANARLIGKKELATNTNAAEGSATYAVFDSNLGWGNASWQDSGNQSWMWKRHAGFDVVAYTGNGTSGHSINHSLGTKSPEMIWIKRRDTSGNAGDWMVGHKGLDGGSSPWNEYLVLNKSQAEMSDNNPFNNVAPTTTSFQLSDWDRVNANNSTYIAMLFASVSGISSVGSYSGSSSDVTINLGFQPRFMIVKAYNSASGNQRWQVMDTLRGMAAGATATNRIYLDDSQAQQAGPYVTSVSSTGITLKTGYSYSNTNNYEYIYYAHA